MAPPVDPLNFIAAEDFFGMAKSFDQPTKVLSVSAQHPDLQCFADVTLQGVSGQPNTHCLIQFVTPTVWRIRYNPKFGDVAGYPDANTRTIVQNSFKTLVEQLQQERRDTNAWNSEPVGSKTPAGPEWRWDTTFEAKDGHWVLSSVEYPNNTSEGKTKTRIYIYDNPFNIQATKWLEPSPGSPAQPSEQVIWATNGPAFSSKGDPIIDVINNVVLAVKKPINARYLGFGEQGGKTVLKKPTYMNYFCFDNFNYNKVYKNGPTDEREPLYHSTPFYIEMNSIPGYRNVTGLMIDNYSQVSMDLGLGNKDQISIGTRFGTFDAWILTADDAPRLIWDYTSIVGRPKLKPRYVLGYGYNSRAEIEGVVSGYRSNNIPLDGLHLDVDFQDRYRTFTSNEINFPNIAEMFNGLRTQGIKCCTNITPIITFRNDETSPYKTLHDFWNTNDKLNPQTLLLVPDKRYKTGLSHPNDPGEVTVTRYDTGGYMQPVILHPNDLTKRISYADYFSSPEGYRDEYVFYEPDPTKQPGNYDSGYPFHGGVSYGDGIGTVGFYPDLNRAVAREKWGQQYEYLFNNGLEFVWQDMTTPAAGNCYGDMLGFPSRLWMTDDVYNQDPNVRPPTKTAIELWSLYSYNLHKATYRGLNKLPGRENKRNFVIGRGSQTGMHRYAGLWTGDNASTWDFWRIAVAQVLALGYSGMTIAGVDMGGFSKDFVSNFPSPTWCDPELLIRWYSGSFLLPWYRNHYAKWGTPPTGKDPSKEFQEPWMYQYAPQKYNVIPSSLYWLYASVGPICRYYVQLRYSLMQVLYDTMFANLIHGLPIARAMLITDPDDTTLFDSASTFVDRQYLLGYQILVCPVTDPGTVRMDVYLPRNDVWYPSNLRVPVDNVTTDQLKHADVLLEPVQGGTTISYDCHLPNATQNRDQMPYVTPVWIRAGSIVPQIDVRQYVDTVQNVPCIHCYPGPGGGPQGTQGTYSMYLDDGVSRDSAPKDLPQYKYAHVVDVNDVHDAPDNEAKSKYREVRIEQSISTDKNHIRTITVTHMCDGYEPTPQIGQDYVFAVWVVKSQAPTTAADIKVNFRDQDGKAVQDGGLSFEYNADRGVLVLHVPTRLVPLSSHQAPKYIAFDIRGLN